MVRMVSPNNFNATSIDSAPELVKNTLSAKDFLQSNFANIS